MAWKWIPPLSPPRRTPQMDDEPNYDDEDPCLDCLTEDDFEDPFFDELFDDDDNLTSAGFDHLADLEKEMLS
jgi:hypothetical protein